MNTDFGCYFQIEDLKLAIRWSTEQGPWGLAVQVITSHKQYVEVLEVFDVGGIVPRWRLRMDDDRIRVTDYLGAINWFASLSEALSFLAPALSGDDNLASDQIFQDSFFPGS